MAEEVFVDAADGVAFDIGGDVLEGAQEADEGGVFDAALVLGEGIAQVVVVFRDGAHGVVDGLADVGRFGEFQEGVVAGGCAQVEDAFGLEVVAGESSPGYWAARRVWASWKRVSAYLRKMRPRTGVEFSEERRPELARRVSATFQRRDSMSLKSVAMRGQGSGGWTLWFGCVCMG